MKANEAPDFPEKVYIPRDPEYPQSPDIWWERESSESNIEYTRTDAFIERAVLYIQQHWIWNTKMIEDFKKYMREE